MTEAELLRAFEERTLPLTEWNHRAHLRVAYAYLDRHPLPEALTRMRAGILAFNASNGIEDTLERGYHETLTQMWMRLMYAVRAVHGSDGGFDAFIERHPYLLQKLLGRLFYSRARIMSAEAKRDFLEPDLTRFPIPPPSSG